jgi:hypothetical protein
LMIARAFGASNKRRSRSLRTRGPEHGPRGISTGPGYFPGDGKDERFVKDGPVSSVVLNIIKQNQWYKHHHEFVNFDNSTPSKETNMKLGILLCLTVLSAAAFAADCTDPQTARRHKKICTRLVDTSKLVLKDCTGELEDGYHLNICENAIHPKTGRKLDCLKPTNDSVARAACAQVPDPGSIARINCEELEDGYSLNHCSEVDLEKQTYLNKVLRR